MSISTYKVTKKSAHIQVFSLDMCRLNYGLSLYRDFFSALNNLRKIFLCHKSRPISDGYDVHSRRPLALSPLAHDTQKKRTRDGRAFDDFQRITAMPQILSCSFYIANLNDKPSTFRT